MAHRRRRIGRRYDPLARRRHTTRAGRRGGDARDRGSPLLRAKKRTATGREDIEVTPAACSTVMVISTGISTTRSAI